MVEDRERGRVGECYDVPAEGAGLDKEREQSSGG